MDNPENILSLSQKRLDEGCRRVIQQYGASLLIMMLVFTIMLFVYATLRVLFGLVLPPEVFLPGLLLLTVNILRLDSRFTILSGVIFLFAIPLLVHYKNEPLAEKVAAVAFMFLFLGVFQQLLELLHQDLKDETDLP